MENPERIAWFTASVIRSSSSAGGFAPAWTGGSHRLHYPKAAKGKGFAAGESVTLYYDPEDPEKMYVEGDRSVLGAEALYFGLAVVLLVLMFSIIR